MLTHNEVSSLFSSNIWAVQESHLEMLMSKVKCGITIESKQNVKPYQSGETAIIPLYGMIDHHNSWVLDWFGGTSCDEFGAAIESAVNDSKYKSIIIDVNSPGGSVYGVQELSDKIYNLRGKKPIIAVSNSLNASAAYWISSAADKVFVAPSSETGSVGVIAVHQDISSAEENIGIKTTIVKAGRYKGEGNPHQPLDSEAQTAIQSRVDEYYESFTKSVARNRGVSQSKVKVDFGEGRVFGSQQAVSSKMANGIMTMSEVLAKVSNYHKVKAKYAGR